MDNVEPCRVRVCPGRNRAAAAGGVDGVDKDGGNGRAGVERVDICVGGMLHWAWAGIRTVGRVNMNEQVPAVDDAAPRHRLPESRPWEFGSGPLSLHL
jgi:hypothetical protein